MLLLEKTGVLRVSNRSPPVTDNNIHITLYRVQLTIRQNPTNTCGVDRMTILLPLFWSVYRFVHQYIISCKPYNNLLAFASILAIYYFSALCVLWVNKRHVVGLCAYTQHTVFFSYRLIIPLFIYILNCIWIINTNIKHNVVIAGIFRIRTRREWRNKLSKES